MAVSIAGVSVLAIAAILLLSAPFFSFAAGTTITVSTDKATYPATVGTQILVNGTISPAPGAGSQTSATIQIKDSSGTLIFIASAPVDGATGAFNYTVVSGPGWKNGTYTVNVVWAATYSGTAYTGSTTFAYGQPTTTTTTSTSSASATTIVTTIITTVSSVTTVIQPGTTTTVILPGTTVTSVTSSVTTIQQASTLNTALAAVAIVIAIVAVVLVFMRKK